MERVKRHFSQDLNTEWESWPWTQRRNMIDSFLKGMTQADYNHTTTPKDVDHLAEKSWPELLRTFIEVDHVIGPGPADSNDPVKNGRSPQRPGRRHRREPTTTHAGKPQPSQRTQRPGTTRGRPPMRRQPPHKAGANPGASCSHTRPVPDQPADDSSERQSGAMDPGPTANHRRHQLCRPHPR